MASTPDPDLAEYVSHTDFQQGLPQGRFRLVVDPKRARAYVGQALWSRPLVTAMLGAGLVLALTGSVWPGGLLVAGGIVLNRAVAWNAARILLFLVTRDASAYEFATQNGILEVQRA
jgi:hypothetical protein